eukprot:UN07958
MLKEKSKRYLGSQYYIKKSNDEQLTFLFGIQKNSTPKPICKNLKNR